MRISKDIILQCDLAWQEKLLELIGCKIGDTVNCTFSVFTGNAKQCFQSSKNGKGIIVKTEKGILVKSLEKYPRAREVRRYPMRPRPTYWHFEDEYAFSKLDSIILND